MHADPMHLRADRDRLLLFAGTGVEPDRREADALVALFNHHFETEGLHLLAPSSGRWYLRAEWVPDLLNRPLSQVIGGSVANALPQGPGASRWMRLHNEVQMLFFASEVNRERERRGRPLISGIWTWGGGTLPTEPSGPGHDSVVADHPLAIGLARHAGLGHRSLKQWCDEGRPAPGERLLIYWDPLWRALQERNLMEWGRALLELESSLAEIEIRLRQGSLSGASLEPCQGMRFNLSRARWRGLLRRRQGLRRLLSVGEGA